MPVWHGDIGKTKTGGRITILRKKRKYELGSNELLTKLGKEKLKISKGKGGTIKKRFLAADFANVFDPSSKVIKKVKITDVIENPANQHFVRRGMITKGATIETELGLARISSRPTHHGVVNAVLIKKK
jgi:small subunit ribosomal protein S8e